ncbi:MAG: class I SAM-dependent methyltransferase [Spirochaetales bacterium]|nr:class I SAM-dependent methyltransferase [Spirochaetales bacterium]
MNSKRQEERITAYSRIARTYKNLFINELQKKPLDRKLYDLFFEKTVNKGKVLEIGCGPGEISNYLWMKGLDITGIDSSPEMIKAAKAYNGEIDFQTGNVFDLVFPDESIMGVVAPYLIVNFDVAEVREAFSEINRVLNRDGIFLVNFHIGNDETVVYEDFIEKGNRISYTFFKVETIKKLLVESGFELTETVTKEPYDGEETVRAFIFSKKNNSR